jgi:hypothetical protein
VAHSIPVLLNTFAHRCFRDTADRDYVAARLAYRARLVPQFLWSSLHCLEKYAKCILLLNRVDERGIKHEVTTAFDLLESEASIAVPLSPDASEFIQRLEVAGRFRYLEVSYVNEDFDIVRLDRAVWEVRRYCQTLDLNPYARNGESYPSKAERLAQLVASTQSHTKGYEIQGGWLEEVLANRQHPARSALVWNNLYAGSSRRKAVRLLPWWMGENAPLELYPHIAEEVTKYVFIPKEIAAHWKAEAARRAAAGAA